MQRLLLIQVNVFRPWATSSLWLMFCTHVLCSTAAYITLPAKALPSVRPRDVNKDGVVVLASPPRGEDVQHKQFHLHRGTLRARSSGAKLPASHAAGSASRVRQRL